ncbi:YigZ family protein [Martelella alba]|uniref:YigZ family protein n=1 Tax=Martelella alba TaxID=2590451 RepID=A0A506UIV1_9HYPH|nr:YigZ family protein [Martelella alba]TPW33261.1 YigZ family protein [Martelella alba]
MPLYALKTSFTFEQDIRKSRFAAIAAPVSGEDEARHFLAENSFADASHNCWAFRIGATYRFFDDGEPGGTAGKPILQAIEGQAVDGVIVIVSRWFGGIKLGAGGLIRAYGGTAAECLRRAEKAEIIPTVSASLHLGFSDIALLDARFAAEASVAVHDRKFGVDGVLMELEIAEDEAARIAAMVIECTNGRSKLVLPDAASSD